MIMSMKLKRGVNELTSNKQMTLYRAIMQAIADKNIGDGLNVGRIVTSYMLDAKKEKLTSSRFFTMADLLKVASYMAVKNGRTLNIALDLNKCDCKTVENECIAIPKHLLAYVIDARKADFEPEKEKKPEKSAKKAENASAENAENGAELMTAADFENGGTLTDAQKAFLVSLEKNGYLTFTNKGKSLLAK